RIRLRPVDARSRSFHLPGTACPGRAGRVSMNEQLAVAQPRRRRVRVGRVLTMVLLVVVCAIVVFPMYWQFLSIVQPLKYSLLYNPSLFFRGFNWAPFRQLFDAQPMARWLWNSARLSLLVTAICLVLSLFGAYVLSHLQCKAKPAIVFFILLTQMVRGAIVIVLVYRLSRELPRINTHPA